ARALLDFGTAGGGDLVDRRAALLMLGHEALVFELRQTRVDGAGARRVGATRALGERLDDAVAVERTLGEETQKVEPQVAVAEDGRHYFSPPFGHSTSTSTSARGATPPRRSTVMSPDTVLARVSANVPERTTAWPSKFFDRATPSTCTRPLSVCTL